MILVESGLNSEQVSLLRPIYIEKWIFDTKTSGLNNEGGPDSGIFLFMFSGNWKCRYSIYMFQR